MHRLGDAAMMHDCERTEKLPHSAGADAIIARLQFKEPCLFWGWLIAPAGDRGGLLRKNAEAMLRARGFEFVHTKQRGSVQVQKRWRRPSGAPLPELPALQSPRADRFFSVALQARPGINHLRFAVELLVREALALGRTPVLFKPRFDPRHNLGHDLDVHWDKYLDLDRIEAVDRRDGAVMTLRALRDDMLDAHPLALACFERAHRITADENDRFDFIVRHNKTGLHVPGVQEGLWGPDGHLIRLHPSPAVLASCERVSARLGSDYCAMHVRRDDMLAMQDKYPNLDRDTQPDRIETTLLRHLPRGARVYLMTNERDKGFFDPLRKTFDLVQYADIPELRAMIETPQPDNFFLFEVEKLLFSHARTKVHTFTHPEGGQRISLTTDTGWA